MCKCHVPFLPVFDVDVGLLGAVSIDDLAALDQDAVRRALHVVHVLQRGVRRHGSTATPAMSQCSSFSVKLRSDIDTVFRSLSQKPKQSTGLRILRYELAAASLGLGVWMKTN